ncbi:hypothetical protein KAT92_06790 [Candidatus Babeliales bacterium]|nr:hypothetical protein [Candidatus Babeliales bacterium]
MSYGNYSHVENGRRTKLSEPSQLTSDANLWTPTSDQKRMLGAEFSTDDGRTFRYCKNGSTEIAKNLMIQSEAIDAQAIDIVQTGKSAAAGDIILNLLITTGNGLADGDLVDGWIIINQGTAATDEGDMYVVKSNKYTTSDTAIRIEIADAGGVRNAISATSNITFVKNVYRDVIVKPTTLTGVMLGATTTIVTASYYFWAQTRGVASVLIDTGDTVVVGEPLGHLDTSGSAGSLGLVAAVNTDYVVGTAISAAAGADYGIVLLNNLP